MAASNTLAYDKADLSAMFEEYESAKFAGRPWQAQAGENTIRIMPPHPNARGRFLIKGGRHWGVGSFPVSCPVAFGVEESCWACKQAALLAASPSKKDKEEGKKLAVSPVWLANVVDMQAPGRGIQVAEFGRTIAEALIKIMKNEDWGDISDLTEGYNIVIEKEGTGQTTKYTTRPRKRASAVSDEILELIEDGGLHDLLSTVTFLDEDEMQDLYEGVESDDNDEEDDEDVKAPRRVTGASVRQPASKRTGRNVDDGDEDEDEDEDEDGDDDFSDEDDADEDLDEDEEDVVVVSPRSSTVSPRVASPSRTAAVAAVRRAPGRAVSTAEEVGGKMDTMLRKARGG